MTKINEKHRYLMKMGLQYEYIKVKMNGDMMILLIRIMLFLKLEFINFLDISQINVDLHLDYVRMEINRIIDWLGHPGNIIA